MKTTIKRVSFTLLICIMAGLAVAPVMAEKVTTVVSGDPGIEDTGVYTYDDNLDDVVVTTTDGKNRVITDDNKKVYVVTTDGKKQVISVGDGMFTTTDGRIHHAAEYGITRKSMAGSAKMGKYAIARDINDNNPDHYIIVGDDGTAHVSG